MNTTHPPGFLDEDIDRREVPALKVHPNVLGEDDEALFAASVADMDFKAPPPVLAALHQRLQHEVLGYEAVPDGLISALTGWLSTRHAWQVEGEQILRAPNVLNALAIAVSLFTDEGDGVIVQPPVFFDFFDIVRDNRRRLVCNPLTLERGAYRMDFDDLDRKASDPRTKMILLCTPHNPVGRVWSAQELTTLGDICARHGVLVVADEIHADIVFPGHRHTPFAALGPSYAQNCITCVSPAKSFNIASCCCAFTVISHADRRKRFQAENSRLTVNKNNAFANVAMQAAYREGAPWLDEVLTYLQGNVAFVKERLADIPGIELVAPQGTFLLWMDFRQLGLSPDDLTAFLRTQAGWVVTRGHAFGAEGNGFARVNIACTRARLTAALQRLAEACTAQAPRSKNPVSPRRG